MEADVSLCLWSVFRLAFTLPSAEALFGDVSTEPVLVNAFSTAGAADVLTANFAALSSTGVLLSWPFCTEMSGSSVPLSARFVPVLSVFGAAGAEVVASPVSISPVAV